MNKQNLSPKGLFPMILFIFIYLGNGIITKDLKSMPVEIAFLISAFIAFFTNKKIKFSKKVDTFCKGGGNPNIVLMILIFILAGAFSQISKDMGAVMSVVNFGLSLFPSKVLVPAIISTILFYIFSKPNLSLIGNEIYEYNILKMVPYILVLVTANSICI